jgi:predicted nucleic acid-binding protein
MEILLDASAIMAVIADEPESEIVINCTKNAIILSPNIVSFEIANGLTKMVKKKIIDTKERMIALIKNFQKIPMSLRGASPAVSLAAPCFNGGSFDRTKA